MYTSQIRSMQTRARDTLGVQIGFVNFVLLQNILNLKLPLNVDKKFFLILFSHINWWYNRKSAKSFGHGSQITYNCK